ncbi:MAG: DUF433 domain-containing protein [Gemmatimonadota bacterium]
MYSRFRSLLVALPTIAVHLATLPMTDILQRITTDPARRGGQPCIRHLRFTVRDIATYRAGGMTPAQILHDFPSLEPADLEACEAYVAAHPEVLEDHPQPERLAASEDHGPTL